jgi:beta-mannosidase
MNGLIPDPFYGNNEQQLQWLDSASFFYNCVFFVDSSLLNRKKVDLVFEGIDTYAQIYLNGKWVGSTDNMFRTWTFPVKQMMKQGENEIWVQIMSNKKITDSIAKSQMPLVRPDNNRVYARKAQYQFGWDWGPSYTAGGIWKPVHIEAYDNLSLSKVKQQYRDLLNRKRKKDMKLIQVKDSIGTSFYFQKNGKPIYMQGANWIPMEAFPGRMTREKYKSLLEMAKLANMNMLRVWGGGIYEDDYFYDLCDSMGIYVWQDFMFAGGMYPTDKNFLENVKSEIKEQIERLRHHPCIVLWCGNNEIEEAWKNWGWQNQFNIHNQDSIRIWNEYKTLFQDSLQAWVNEFDGTRPYIATSPKNGWGRPESILEGDSHYWGIWWGLENWEVFQKKTGRFVSEYGMQSMSSLNTVKMYTDPESRFLYSDKIKAHQKANDGFKKLNHYLHTYFLDTTNLKYLNLSDYIYLTQCMQSYILSHSIAVHKSKYPINMGTLLWQLNDCWPTTSWSIIDYQGIPKAAWYAVKEAYSEKKSNATDTLYPKNISLIEPHFTIDKIDDEHISIRSDVDAKYVYLFYESGEGYFSDNYFNLKRNEIKQIKIQSFLGDGELKVMSLFDIQQKTKNHSD